MSACIDVTDETSLALDAVPATGHYENAMPRSPLHATGSRIDSPDRVIVLDPRMREIYSLLEVFAPSPLPVLVLGETGVGKDVFAGAVHERSTRRARNFVQINCAAVPEPLLENELFGHAKGAFTGAVTATEGLFEAADGGTVFLDEIGEMPLSTQAKLLRVLENGEMKRIGSVRPRRVDVRVVAATNRDLAERCEAGAFRCDLYFRLAGAIVTIPALRERPQEIEPLAEHFVHAAARRLGRPTPRLAQGAIAKLRAHDWPGNIRELRNVMERAILEARCGVVDAGAIKIHPAPRGPRSCRLPPPGPRGEGEDVEPTPPPSVEPLRSDIKALERQRIVVALEACGGNQTRAAKVLGMPRRSLVRRIDEFGLVRPRKRRIGV